MESNNVNSRRAMPQFPFPCIVSWLTFHWVRWRDDLVYIARQHARIIFCTTILPHCLSHMIYVLSKKRVWQWHIVTPLPMEALYWFFGSWEGNGVNHKVFHSESWKVILSSGCALPSPETTQNEPKSTRSPCFIFLIMKIDIFIKYWESRNSK